MTSPLASTIGRLGAASCVQELAQTVREEAARNERVINLVPSENRLSPRARIPLSTDFYNRYFFNTTGAPDFWEFRGGEAVADLETIGATESLGRLARVEHVNVRPISGLNAMAIALAGLGGPVGGAVVSIASRSGGHYATQGLTRRLGFVPVEVDTTAGVVHADELIQVLTTRRVSLVYLDLQNSLYPVDVAACMEVVREYSPKTLVHVDVSHPLGLVLGGQHANPLDLGADSMGGSTHKTFPGPHKGVLFTRSQKIAQHLADAQLHLLSSHHFAETLALAFTALEFETYGARYAQQVIENGRELGRVLLDRGFEVARARSGITDNHQVWVTMPAGADVHEFSRILASGGIRINLQTGLPGFAGTTMRLGVAEPTLLGATQDALSAIGDAFVAARRGSSTDVEECRQRALEAMEPPFYCADEDTQDRHMPRPYPRLQR